MSVLLRVLIMTDIDTLVSHQYDMLSRGYVCSEDKEILFRIHLLTLRPRSAATIITHIVDSDAVDRQGHLTLIIVVTVRLQLV